MSIATARSPTTLNARIANGVSPSNATAPAAPLTSAWRTKGANRRHNTAARATRSAPCSSQSDLFTEREKLALDYTVAVMRTPVEVTDGLFARMKEHFSDEQLVEITAPLTVVNLDRFNAAFGIGSAGFSDGMVCVPPEGPARAPAPERVN